jgi:hypothetical protein
MVRIEACDHIRHMFFWEQPMNGKDVSQSGVKGVTLVVLSEEKVGEIIEKSRGIISEYQKHQLELIRMGVSAELQANDGCCNCVLC